MGRFSGKDYMYGDKETNIMLSSFKKNKNGQSPHLQTDRPDYGKKNEIKNEKIIPEKESISFRVNSQFVIEIRKFFRTHKGIKKGEAFTVAMSDYMKKYK